MFVPAHSVDGYALAPITSGATTIQLDPVAAVELSIALGGTNHTYLLVDAGRTAKEVVRADSIVGNLVTVTRAQDGTQARAFPTATRVRYVMTAAAAAEAAYPALTITGDDRITVDYLGGNEYVLNLVPLEIHSPNYTVYAEYGSGGQLGLSVDGSALGCCPGDGGGGEYGGQ